MSTAVNSGTTPVLDLKTCDQEPIHIPGSIQPHGVLLALSDGQFRVEQASNNCGELFGRPQSGIRGSKLGELFDSNSAEALVRELQQSELEEYPVYLRTVAAHPKGTSFYAIAHRYAGTVILELEPCEPGKEISFRDLQPVLGTSLHKLKRTNAVRSLAELAAAEVKRLTGYGRVLVYRFDSQWNGHVIAEVREPSYGSYLDLWFPASDIPEQARRLYELNRLRIIADAGYVPAVIEPAANPKTGKPLDLSFATLRSVSPVHLEYLRNMGVASSMSISLLTEEGRLWGLIACHHRTPHFVPYEIRTVCDLLAQTISTRLTIQEQHVELEEQIRLNSLTTQLLALMAKEEEFLDGLRKNPSELLEFAKAGGAAVVHSDECTLIGDCPAEDRVWRIIDFLVQSGREEIFHTNSLPELLAHGELYRAKASGLLAISISKIHRSYLLWFRPEVVQTVNWAGDPQKTVEIDTAGTPRLHPRRSFETWKETVRGRSLPWTESEIEAAGDLRNAIIGVVLKNAEELAQISEELQRSNKELEAFSYSVSHDLRAPFRHIVGFSELVKQSANASLGETERRYIDIIIQSAQFAGTLVDNLLSFSQVGRAKLKKQKIPMAGLVRDVVRDLETDIGQRRVVWNIGPLPEVEGDLVMLRLVWQNLLQNALKYTRNREEAVVDIAAAVEGPEAVFSVRDNGVGFEQQYAGKLFGVFQRLHKMEEFEGTGIGLANVRRIVGRHRGRTWAEGEVNKGAAFFFSLPVKTENGDS
jgi:light-regulated signal transduction histidine kinase (bacteriophytochrome)